MKKALSILLAMVLFVGAMSIGDFALNASAACAQHIYTNACDTLCNECSAIRFVEPHSYEDCFDGYENNNDTLGEWTKTASTTGIFSITPVDECAYFTNHYLVVTDKNGVEVNFYEFANGWPLVKEQEYTVYLKCQYDDTDISNIDFNLVEVSNQIFPDVKPNKWYSDAVMYAVGAGILKGYSDGSFGTVDSIQRQDFLVMLARFDGADLTQYSGNSTFSDVSKNGYYKAAVNWAVQNNITTGYTDGSNRFGVGDPITREQIVTFLYRYAQYKGISVDTQPNSTETISSRYKDFSKVSDFSKKEMIWALEKGIIKGEENPDKTETKINPQGNAQRCHVAQIMYNNYLQNIIPGKKLCVHSYSDATCTEPKKCIHCGRTKGEKLGHSYCDATCTQPQTCSVCNDKIGEPKGHKYVLGECVNINDNELCGDYSKEYCPKLYFTGDMSNMTSKKDVRDITFEYRSKEQILTGAAKIKPQGTSSMKYDKKNFTINFYEDSSYSQELGVNVGWGAQTKYCLKANWIDKTHSRNVVTAKLVGEMQRKYGLFMDAPNNGAIDGFPVEVYINNTFHGLYTMNIPKDAWQFGMDENNPNHIVICGENWNDPVLFKDEPNLSDWSVEVGPENEETLSKLKRLSDFIRNSTDQEFKANFEQYLNLDATLNYYVMMTYGWMPDNYGKNMLLATYDGQVWYPSLYDLDTTWGTHWEGNKLYNYSSGVTNGSGSELWKKFERVYKKEIATRYFELREDVLDPEHVMDEFRSFYESIPTEVLDRETAKWNTAETPIPGYDIPQILDYLNTVVPRLDARYAEWLYN